MNTIARAFVLSIGAELLTGRTLDRNGNRLAKLLTGLGLEVLEIRAVADDIDVVADAIAQQFDRAGGLGALVVTTGGLGATPDDRTLTAVARACGLDLEISQSVRTYVEERYRRLQAGESGRAAVPVSAVHKLSHIPRTARWIPNPVGIAPGVITPRGDGYVYSLPGVPSEAFGIFESQESADLLRDLGICGGYCEMVTQTDANFETQFENIIAAMSTRFPDILVKPIPKRFGPEVQMVVRIAARGENFELARQAASAAMEAFRSMSKGDGIGCEPPIES